MGELGPGAGRAFNRWWRWVVLIGAWQVMGWAVAYPAGYAIPPGRNAVIIGADSGWALWKTFVLVLQRMVAAPMPRSANPPPTLGMQAWWAAVALGIAGGAAVFILSPALLWLRGRLGWRGRAAIAAAAGLMAVVPLVVLWDEVALSGPFPPVGSWLTALAFVLAMAAFIPPPPLDRPGAWRRWADGEEDPDPMLPRRWKLLGAGWALVVLCAYLRGSDWIWGGPKPAGQAVVFTIIRLSQRLGYDRGTLADLFAGLAGLAMLAGAAVVVISPWMMKRWQRASPAGRCVMSWAGLLPLLLWGSLPALRAGGASDWSYRPAFYGLAVGFTLIGMAFWPPRGSGVNVATSSNGRAFELVGMRANPTEPTEETGHR